MDLIEARNMAIEVMEENLPHGSGWKFEFDNGRSRFGQCRHRTRTITLSRHLVAANTRQRVYLILLHEIAHALTPGHKHDKVWKAKLIELGGDGKARYSIENTVVKSRFSMVCNPCGKSYPRHRRTPKVYLCRSCRGVLSWAVN